MIPDFTLRVHMVYRQQAPQSIDNHLRNTVGPPFIMRVAILIAEIYDELQLFIKMRFEEFRDWPICHSGFALSFTECRFSID